MKNHYFLLIFSFFLQNITAQSVQWFAPGAHWEYNYYDYSSPSHQGKRTLFVDGTEVISGKVFTKFSGAETSIGPQNTVITQDLIPFYCYAENDTVFIKYSNSSTTEVLYDFTKQVGDTIKNIWPYNFGVLVETGDTILWGGISTRYQKWAKKMINLPDDNAYVYEGIGGDNFELWFYSSINGITELYQKIICYRDDFYSEPSCQFTSNSSYPLFSSKTHLSPNPVTDFFTLDLPSEILPAKLVVSDILGRKINSFSQTETLQRFDFQGDRLKSGLYFLEIKGKNGVILSRKFVH
jgi:Secretion system C-terminal sorting domain